MRPSVSPASPGPAPAGVASRADRVAALLYGSFAYVCFLGTFLYAIGFVKNAVPKSIDRGASAPVASALLVDAALLGLFAVQHSIMARGWFKERWTRVVRKPIERSTYVLVTCIVLNAMYLGWRPVTATVWNVTNPVGSLVLEVLSWLGWALVLVATFLIDHFDLFGLKQVVRYFRREPHADPAFRVVSFYRYTRHPLYLGFTVAFWATPVMTAGHLLFAALTTGYMVVAIRLEERDLLRAHTGYADYRARVPMLVPTFVKRH